MNLAIRTLQLLAKVIVPANAPMFLWNLVANHDIILASTFPILLEAVKHVRQLGRRLLCIHVNFPKGKTSPGTVILIQVMTEVLRLETVALLDVGLFGNVPTMQCCLLHCFLGTEMLPLRALCFLQVTPAIRTSEGRNNPMSLPSL